MRELSYSNQAPTTHSCVSNMMQPSLLRSAVLGLAVTATFTLATPSWADGEPTFTRLGYLDGNTKPRGSHALGLSPDGSTIVGHSYIWDDNIKATEVHGFHWTPDDGMTDLGLLPNGLEASSAHAVSADGTLVVGAIGFVLDTFYELRNGIYWENADSNPQAYLIDEAVWAQAITPDGNMIVGATRIPGPWPIIDSAFYYTTNGGLVEIGFLPDGVYSAGEDVSADGSVIVGYGDGHGAIAAFRWTAQDGVQFLEGQEIEVPSQAFAISPDGQTITGIYEDQAFRWTENDLFEPLGLLPGAWRSYGYDLTADGSVIVGYNLDLDDNRVGFIWDETNGMRATLDALAEDYGFDLKGWSGMETTGISDDGTVIIGHGVSPEGHVEGWAVHTSGIGAPDLQLTFEGKCPDAGKAGVQWEGGEPEGKVALVYARNQGSTTIPNGPCPGIQLDLGSKRLQLAFVLDSDSNGAGTHVFSAPAGACGGFLQLVDLKQCTTSNVEPVD